MQNKPKGLFYTTTNGLPGQEYFAAGKKLCYTVNMGGDLLKQTEKNRRSREYIIERACEEFSAHGYSGGSLNRICAGGGISKGLLYHYYAGRNELYLACVERMFREMTDFLRERLDLESVTVGEYFSLQMEFFRLHPQYRGLFCDVLVYPQAVLAEQTEQMRQEFDSLNNAALSSVLSRERLAPGLTLDTALVQFRAFVNSLGIYMREDSAQDTEAEAEALLHTMLYGILARD